MTKTSRTPSLGRRLVAALLVLAGGGIFVVIVAAVIILSGAFDVAATSKHGPLATVLLHFTMRRSVAAHAPALTPPNLDDPALILRGATHYASGCAPCHGGPGELASPIAQQMTPVPPGLYDVGRDFPPDQLFWIVKHGVKMTAMPAWPAQGRDDEIWAMVAFLRHLPQQNTEAYARLTGIAGGPGFLDGGMPRGPAGFDPAACSRCHGSDGMGRAGAFPRLAGLGAAYLAATLRAFRDGSRPSGFMQPIAAAMTDQQIAAAAKYFAGLPAKPAAAPPALAVASSAATPPGAEKCLACHTPDPARRRPEVPGLAGEPASYLAEQLRLLGQGERPSTARAAHRVPQSEVAALAAYLGSPPGAAPSATR